MLLKRCLQRYAHTHTHPSIHPRRERAVSFNIIVKVIVVTYSVSQSALALTCLMLPWWVMIHIEDFTDVTLASEDTDHYDDHWWWPKWPKWPWQTWWIIVIILIRIRRMKSDQVWWQSSRIYLPRAFDQISNFLLGSINYFDQIYNFLFWFQNIRYVSIKLVYEPFFSSEIFNSVMVIKLTTSSK